MNIKFYLMFIMMRTPKGESRMKRVGAIFLYLKKKIHAISKNNLNSQKMLQRTRGLLSRQSMLLLLPLLLFLLILILLTPPSLKAFLALTSINLGSTFLVVGLIYIPDCDKHEAPFIVGVFALAFIFLCKGVSLAAPLSFLKFFPFLKPWNF